MTAIDRTVFLVGLPTTLAGWAPRIVIIVVATAIIATIKLLWSRRKK